MHGSDTSPSLAELPLALLFWGLICAYAAAFLVVPAVPLQDYPDWLYQSHVAKLKFEGDPAAADFAFKPYPVPYTLHPLLLAGLMYVVDPLTAGKVAAALSVLALGIGLSSFANAWDPAHVGSKALILLPAIGLSVPFWLGYINFTFGFGLLLYLLARDGRDRLGPLGLCLGALVMFFVHAVALGGLVLYLGWRHVLLRRDIGRLIALLPAAALVGWYAYGRFVVDADPGLAVPVDPSGCWLKAVWDYVKWKPVTLAQLGPYENFVTAGDEGLLEGASVLHYHLGTLNVLFVAGLLATAFGALARDASTPAWNERIPPAVLLVVAFIAAPPVNFLGLINVGERLLLIALAPLLAWARPGRGLTAVLVAVTLPLHAYNIWVITHVAPDSRAIFAAKPPVPAEQRVYGTPIATRFDWHAKLDQRPLPALSPGYGTSILYETPRRGGTK
jgi:hypothetical protein